MAVFGASIDVSDFLLNSPLDLLLYGHGEDRSQVTGEGMSFRQTIKRVHFFMVVEGQVALF